MNGFPGAFCREWFRSPLEVGAVAPSSTGLARMITRGLGPGAAPVLELGPGTGVFTRRMIAQGVPASAITAIEANRSFASVLTQTLPEIEVLCGDASRMVPLLIAKQADVKTVICGLPLLSMPMTRVYRIMKASFQVLSDDGEFRLFTYGPNCPVPRSVRDRLDLRAERIGFVPLNVPPASVYTVKRRPFT